MQIFNFKKAVAINGSRYSIVNVIHATEEYISKDFMCYQNDENGNAKLYYPHRDHEVYLLDPRDTFSYYIKHYGELKALYKTNGHYCFKDDKNEFHVFSADEIARIEDVYSAKLEGCKPLSVLKQEAQNKGEPILYKMYSLPEEQTPLKNDGEGDMVTCSVYIMPDGSLQTQYSHDY